MTEILWLGRGGQGAFTSAKLTGAAFTSRGDDHFALAFPSFGPERRGAPVRAFTKLDTRPVCDRSETEKADHIVILDETLFADGLREHLKPGGNIIINSVKNYGDNIISFNASALAKSLSLPVVNTVMLGALGKISGIISREDIFFAIENYMPERIREKNINAVTAAWEAFE